LDAVVTAIVADARREQTLFAGAWMRDPLSADRGGVFRSDDGGRTWKAVGLADQAVRALVQSPSDPDILIAGSLEGVFASQDAGENWARISPVGHPELRNIDSLAIDPRDAEVIYAGTFHLPWKTVDGGKNWNSVHRGMIDDSDVMSLLVDRSNPSRIYAGACSGIYRSDDGAGRWQKVQGIPFSARRTHVIAQDAENARIVYAGTTEGLWKSGNSGATWKRVTPANWVINGVQTAPGHPGRVVIGTNHLGILVSDDGGEKFRASNEGFHHRRTVAMALDSSRSGRVLAVLEGGGDPLVVTDDDGRTWRPLGQGLSTRQLRHVFATPHGWWASLAEGGLMRYDPHVQRWAREGRLEAGAAATAAARAGARGAVQAKSLNMVVTDMAFGEARWFAATERGLLVSEDGGRHWRVLPIGPIPDLPTTSVWTSRDARSLWVVSLRGLVYSADGGQSWVWRDVPLDAGGALQLAVAPDAVEGGTLVVRAANGLYISRDAGITWGQAGSGLPQVPIDGIAVSGGVFVASPRTGGLYLSSDSGRTWARLPGTVADGYFPVVAADDRTATVVVGSTSDGLFSLGFASHRPEMTHLSVEP
jgi:photosystem II stability/assembly factor-like uncharacterized protein